MDVGGALDGADDVAIRKRKRSADDIATAGTSAVEQDPLLLDSQPQLQDQNDVGASSKKARVDQLVTPLLTGQTRIDASIKDSADLSRLPPELLQYIFSFVDPPSLGRLSSVNRVFNTLLDPAKDLPQASPDAKLAGLRSQNDLWASSRRAFSSGFPRPMDSMTEPEMWRLIRGKSCQFCGKKAKSKPLSLAISPWNAGPGSEGVCAVWPFRIRTCGRCLELRSIKETELLFSPCSALRPGLPFAFFTPSMNYVTSVTLRQLQPPPHLQLTKYYFRAQVESLELQYDEVRGLGGPAAEEWYKGLDSHGKLQMDEGARFERWELGSASYEHAISTSSPRPAITSSPALSLARSFSGPPGFSPPMHIPVGRFPTQGSPPRALQNFVAPPIPSPLPQMPLQPVGLAPGQQRPLEAHPPPGSFARPAMGASTGSFQRAPKPRTERHFRDIVQMKADRRAEIERRCGQLHPPIRPSTLTFMEAFHAAIQIPMTLNDNAWEVLKTRILDQRAEAEQKEDEREAAIRASKMEVDERQRYEEQRRRVQENANRVWSKIQTPIREKLKQYADDFIRVAWADGQSVTKATSSKFAVDVLRHVRERFHEVLAEEDTMLSKQGITIPHDSPILAGRRLKLDDVKWIFEETVRPHTDPFGREIFLCSACDINHKYFSFDSLIQHFAAKHTSALSHGNTVVYWKADWPEDPPFHPSPDHAWNGVGGSATSPLYTPGAHNSWTSSLTPGQPNGIYHVQSDEVVAQARQVWDATDRIMHLPSSVRLYVVIHRVMFAFSQKFTNEPTLSLFMDCVNNKPILKELKSVSGLHCKACQTFGNIFSEPAESDYHLVELMQHFHRSHIEYGSSSPQSNFTRPISTTGTGAPRMDWKFDMIDLPNEAVIRNLMSSPGMDQHKLELIASAFPAYFPQPLPHIKPIPYPSTATSAQIMGLAAADRPTQKESPSHSAVGATGIRLNASRMEYSIPAEDEYDPQRPQPPPFRSYPAYQSSRKPLNDPSSTAELVYINHHRPAPSRYGYEAARRVVRVDHRDGPYIIREAIDAHDDHYNHQRLGVAVTPYEERERFLRPREEFEETIVPNAPSRMPPLEPVPDPHMSPLLETGHRDVAEEAGMSDAEVFLNNFGNIAPPSFEETSRMDNLIDGQDTSNLDNNSHREHQTQTSLSVPARTWQNADEPTDDASTGRRHGLREAPYRQSSVASMPRPDEPAAVVQLGIPPVDNVGSITRSREETAPARRPSEPPHEPTIRRRRALVEYDRDGIPLHEVVAGDEWRDEREYYGQRVSLEPRATYGRMPPSPEQLRRRLDDLPTRYIEVLPSGERQYMDEPRYMEPVYQPVEYIRLAAREMQHSNPGYYVDHRRLNDMQPEYGYGRRLAEEPLYESGGHYYTRAPQPRGTRPGGYEDDDELYTRH